MPRCHAPLLLIPALLSIAPALASAQVSSALQHATLAVTRPSANTPIHGTVWLSLPGQAALEQAVNAIYNPSSPTYHKFFTWATLAPYLPTTSQLSAVKTALNTHNLTVTTVDPHNLRISFEGKAADFEAAFHTSIEQHTLANGSQVRAFTSTPALENAAGLAQAVTGIGETGEEPALATPTDPRSGQQLGIETLQQAAVEATTSGPYYCFFSPASTLLATPGQFLPDAAYVGPLYSAPLSGGKPSSVRACRYTPAQFFYQTGLNTIQAAGYTGAGQTIAILEEIGSPTLAADLAAFDQIYNLPAANLQIVNLTSGNPVPSTGQIHETTLDVEWAHAVAPAAKLLVVDTNPDDLPGGLSYIVGEHLADTVSISYGNTELTAAPGRIQAWNTELMIASGLDINVDVSSDDFGDLVADEGSADVDVPADSPYATAVGGLTIAYAPGTNNLYKTSWGRDETLIGTNGVPLATPQPVPHSTNKFGSGGGISTLFPIPGYQAALGGSGRHVPDVSDIADPLTGLKIVITDSINCTSNPCSEIEGGTSLATPVFSGKWALLNQLHGASLGQAAPLIAAYARTPAIEDIVPLPSFAVLGASLSLSGLQTFSANYLASPETSQPFVSALWQQATTGDDYVVSFGTDSSLAVTSGYDYATGWGSSTSLPSSQASSPRHLTNSSALRPSKVQKLTEDGSPFKEPSLGPLMLSCLLSRVEIAPGDRHTR